MEEGNRISEYFTKVLTITNQMKGFGESISDLMVVEKIMRLLHRNSILLQWQLKSLKTYHR